MCSKLRIANLVMLQVMYLLSKITIRLPHHKFRKTEYPPTRKRRPFSFSTSGKGYIIIR